MGFVKAFKNKIFSEKIHDFDGACLELFRFQAEHNKIYARYIQSLCLDPAVISEVRQIPFLPVELFKTQKILCEGFSVELIFESSGTGNNIPSRHFISHPDFYEESFTRSFEMFFGSPKEYTILALLPSYLERNNASLVYMVDRLMKLSGQDNNGFYLNDYKNLNTAIREVKSRGEKVLLFAVTFALLEFMASENPDLSDVILVETGGMKGRGRELPREELYEILGEKAGADRICSEYGMTELQSQAWSKSKGKFLPPPWMKVLVRDIYDPLTLLDRGKKGCLNIIDLANISSCAFIGTQDLGSVSPDGSFEVIGRVDHSEIRGCNLLAL